MRRNGTRAAVLIGLAFAAASEAFAAGGHHAVDDATILAPGECELQTWLSHGSDRAKLLHGGAGCRVGPVQLGVAGDHVRQHGTPSGTAWSLEAKWAGELVEGFSIGAVLQPAWAAQARPRYQGVAFAALATWTPREDLAFHLNAGRDFLHRGDGLRRGGAAVEWRPAKQWSLLAERYLEQDTHLLRAAVRWLGGESWSMDFSRAQRLAGPGPSTWTIGYTRVFDGKD